MDTAIGQIQANGQARREQVEVGDGLLEITLGTPPGLTSGTLVLTVDPVSWVRWHQDWRAPEGAGPWAMHDAAAARIKEENKLDLNATQVDAFLHGILAWFAQLKKKQRATLGLPSSTGSPPSE